jgi:hypothetical protein
MMPVLSSLGERRGGGNVIRFALSITGDVSPAEQVDSLAIFEQLSRDAGRGVRCARYRIEARAEADLSFVHGVMILEDERAIFHSSVDRTMLGAVRKVDRRLRAQLPAASRRPVDRTALPVRGSAAERPPTPLTEKRVLEKGGCNERSRLPRSASQEFGCSS